MKVKGLDGRSYKWNLAGHVPLGSDERPRSKYHVLARELLAKLYPMDQRLEELPLPGSGGLFADFFLPGRRLLIEVHGAQHYERSSFFHETPLAFIQGQGRDKRKTEWAELNNLVLVELPYDRIDEWAARIARAAGTNGGRET